MNNAPHPASSFRALDAAGKAIQRQAAEWLARREARNLSLTEQADFAEWMAQDPRHAAIFAEVEFSWKMFDRLAAYPHSDDVAADPDLLVPARSKFRDHAYWRPLSLAAAAAIAVGSVFWFGRSTNPTAGAPAITAVQTEPRFIHLSDGSTVELNAGSVVTEHFTSSQRRLRLVSGEAHFAVAKDPSREFIVEAHGVAVRAIGTAFNVRMQGANIEVLVTEGTVRVAPPIVRTPPSVVSHPAAADRSDANLSATLIAGQRTVVPVTVGAGTALPPIETLAPADIERALAWQTSRLNFDAIALSEIVGILNRHLAGKKGAPHLTIQDNELGALLVSGRVRTENIESFVEALESSFGVVAKHNPDGQIELRQAQQAEPAVK